MLFFILSVYFSRLFGFQDLEALPNTAIQKEVEGSGDKHRMGGKRLEVVTSVKPAAAAAKSHQSCETP